jgi:hypothetical protein
VRRVPTYTRVCNGVSASATATVVVAEVFSCCHSGGGVGRQAAVVVVVEVALEVLKCMVDSGGGRRVGGTDGIVRCGD